MQYPICFGLISVMDYYQLKNMLTQGMRLPNPTDCSETIAQIILRCFYENPEKRSTFAEIKMDLLADYAELQKKYLKPANSNAEVCEEGSIIHANLEHTKNLRQKYLAMQLENATLGRRTSKQSLELIQEVGTNVRVKNEKANQNDFLHYADVPLGQDKHCTNKKVHEMGDSNSNISGTTSHKTRNTLKRCISSYEEKQF